MYNICHCNISKNNYLLIFFPTYYCITVVLCFFQSYKIFYFSIEPNVVVAAFRSVVLLAVFSNLRKIKNLFIKKKQIVSFT